MADASDAVDEYQLTAESGEDSVLMRAGFLYSPLVETFFHCDATAASSKIGALKTALEVCAAIPVPKLYRSVQVVVVQYRFFTSRFSIHFMSQTCSYRRRSRHWSERSPTCARRWTHCARRSSRNSDAPSISTTRPRTPRMRRRLLRGELIRIERVEFQSNLSVSMNYCVASFVFFSFFIRKYNFILLNCVFMSFSQYSPIIALTMISDCYISYEEFDATCKSFSNCLFAKSFSNDGFTS